MGDFRFIFDKISKKWVVLAPRRSIRPDVSHEAPVLCPFCPGREKDEPDVFRIGGEKGDSDWEVRVINNKFPFAPIHEIIIHSPDHHKNFDELPLDQIENIIQVYKNRLKEHKDKGQVYIFHNRGEAAGESLPHPHTQFVVVSSEVKLDMPLLCPDFENDQEEDREWAGGFYYKSMNVSVPMASQWPDEVWISAKNGGNFGDMPENEVSDLSFALNRIIRILNLRHGEEFPFNFYINMQEWYLRIIPRVKSLGGFEIGTGIFINTQDPVDTFNFIKEHFDVLDEDKIKKKQKADYDRSV